MSKLRRWLGFLPRGPLEIGLVVLSLPISFLMAIWLFGTLVPDIHAYLFTDYPWYVSAFFPPVDSGRHPEPGLHYFALCILVGMALTLLLVRGLKNWLVKKQPDPS